MKKMKKSKIQVLVALLVCLALAFTACGGNQGDAAASGDKVLKLAVCTPLTGEAAKAGTEFKDTASMALEAAGYKVGDYTIDPIYVDITTDPEKGALALEQAIIKDGVQAAILNWNSSVAMSLMDVASKYKIPYYFPLGASSSIDEKWKSDPEKYSYYIAKAWAQPEYMSSSYVTFVEGLIKDGTWAPRNKNIFIYGDDTDWGRAVGGNFKKLFAEAGWTVVGEEYFAMGTTDFYATLSKIKSADASLIGGTISSPASAAAFLKQAREIDLKSLTICDALSENADFYELAGDASDGVLDNRPLWTSEKALAFAKDFEAKFGYAPAAATGGQVWDYTRFFLQVCQETIDKYGTLDSESLYNFAQEVLLVGGTTFTDGINCEEYKFTEEWAPGPVVGEGYYVFPILQFEKGETKAVWPSGMSNGEFVVPDYAK